MNKPQVKHYPAHGSGFFAYYDVSEVDAYAKELEARVAILDAQKVELPELQLTEADEEAVRKSSQECPDLPSVYFTALVQLCCRELQLLDALRAVQANTELIRQFHMAAKLLLETHCCDSGAADYIHEWLDENTTICDDCRPIHAAIAACDWPEGMGSDGTDTKHQR